MSAPAMKIRAIAPWFGAKRSLARRIVGELGEHRSYHEPFCGGLAVLLAKPAAQQETVCDLHGDLTNLAFVLQDQAAAEDLYDRLVRTLFSEALLHWAVERLQTTAVPCGGLDVERAYAFFIHSWCARNGTSGSRRMSFQLAVRYTPNGGSATTRFKNAIDSIPAWHERLRAVVILNRDAFDVIPRISDQAGVVIYCDPPYLHSTRSGDGDGGYLHDFVEGGGLLGGQDDHGRLAEQLTRFRRTRVVVSYYAHPRLEDLYPPGRWTHVPCPRQKNLRRSLNAVHELGEAPEVLIVNGRSHTEDDS